MFRAIPSHLETLLLHLTLGWMKLTRQETAASQMLFPALYGKISPRIIWVSLQGMVLWTHCLTSMGHGTTHYKIRTPCVTICEAAVDMHYDGHWRWEPCEDLIVLYLGPFKYSQSGLHWLEPLESHICWLREPHLFVMMSLSSMSWLPPAMCLCAKLLGNRITKLWTECTWHKSFLRTNMLIARLEAAYWLVTAAFSTRLFLVYEL